MITETNASAMDICLFVLFVIYFCLAFSVGLIIISAWIKELTSDKITSDEDKFHEPENQNHIKKYNRYKKITNIFRIAVYIFLFAICANILAIIFLWIIR